MSHCDAIIVVSGPGGALAAEGDYFPGVAGTGSSNAKGAKADELLVEMSTSTTWNHRMTRSPIVLAKARLQLAVWALAISACSGGTEPEPPAAVSTVTVSPSSTTDEPKMRKTRELLLPETVNTLAPGPLIVRLLLTTSCPVVSVIVQGQPGRLKLIVSPLAAAAICLRKVPGPLSARLVTLSVAARTLWPRLATATTAASVNLRFGFFIGLTVFTMSSGRRNGCRPQCNTGKFSGSFR